MIHPTAAKNPIVPTTTDSNPAMRMSNRTISIILLPLGMPIYVKGAAVSLWAYGFALAYLHGLLKLSGIFAY